MSIQMLCNGCALGDHTKHDPAHGLRPGLIGGSYCACTGDCAAKFEAMAQKLLRLTKNAKPHPTIGLLNPREQQP